MATISTLFQLGDRMSAPLYNIIATVDSLISAFDETKSAVGETFDPTQINMAREKIGLATRQLEEMESSMRDVGHETAKTTGLIGLLQNQVGSLIGAYAGIKGLQSIVGLSDTMTQIRARINMVNDGHQTTLELQQKIFDSANRARANYLMTSDVIGKLSLQAKNAFSDNDETIAFAEALNKTFKVSGTSAQGVESVMYNLTQALSAGVLRGQDFNSVMQNAPLILEKVADYMEQPRSKIRELAMQGQLSASVVKNAMLAASAEIDAEFKKIPYTWGEIWTMGVNQFIMMADPMLNTISFLAQNWEMLESVLLAGAIALGIFSAATFVQSGAFLSASVAAWAFTNALLSNPLTWVAVAIGAVVGIIYHWIKAAGGLEVAWMIVVDKILTGQDTIALGFASLGTAIQDIWGHAWGGILMFTQNVINGIIQDINAFISALNTVPGVELQLLEKHAFATQFALEEEARRQVRSEDLDLLAQVIVDEQQERSFKITTKQQELNAPGTASAYGGSSIPEPFSQNIQEIAGNTGSIKDSLEITKEELQYIRDIAEREIINRYTTADVKVEMVNNNSIASDVDADAMFTQFVDRVEEAVSAAIEGV